MEKVFASLVEVMFVAYLHLTHDEQEDMLLHALINQNALFNESWGLLDNTVKEVMADGGKTIRLQMEKKELTKEMAKKASAVRAKATSKELWNLMAATWRENK